MVKTLKQVALLASALLFLLSPFLHSEFQVSAQVVKNPYELIVATIGEPQTVDPAECYDTASAELIMNIYDTLLRFDGEAVDRFLPCLATSWSYDEATFTFTIREGVPWHDPAYGTVTPADVEYSFERWMVMDKDGGPTWMIYEPLLGTYGANMDDPEFINKIDAAVESDDTNVYFHLVGPFASMIVYQVFAQQWASVLDKEWAIEQGCWNGVYTMASMTAYHNPDVSPLMNPEPVMMGQGPYIFDYWDSGLEWSIYKFDDYWQGWPGPHPTTGTARGYLDRVTEKFITDWPTRKLLFLAGDIDLCYVPRMYMEDVWGQPGIRCVYPLPILSCTGVFFNYNISLSSRYLKPPVTSYECDYGELNENGLPPDFFSDVDVRKAFAYSINYTEFLQEAFVGEALYPGTPAITGLPYRNQEQEKYEFNLTKAEEHLKKAWNGQLWTSGFNLTIRYAYGSLSRKVICEMLKTNIESLNPKFHIRLFYYFSMLWPDLELLGGELPLFIIGWLADYPDPHNFFHPFMHSEGVFAGWQSYSDSYADALIEEGGTCTDPVRREEIYFELQRIYHNDCPSIPIYQPLGRHWERTWVQGWYYHNPAFPGLYFYHLWKEDLPPEDLNLDGTVNILDVVVAAKAFASFCRLPDVHPRWNSRADFNHDQKVNIHDIAAIANKFGSQTLPWQPP